MIPILLDNVRHMIIFVKHYFYFLTVCPTMLYIVAMIKKDALTSLRTQKDLKEKLSFISVSEDRSLSSQMERFLKQGVTKWEAEHGLIVFRKPG